MMDNTIKGFDQKVQGALLNQVVKSENGYGIAYERCLNYQKDFHTHDRYNIAFPRGSSSLLFETKKDGSFQVQSHQVLIMAPNIIHKQKCLTSIWDNFALFPQLEKIKKYKLPANDIIVMNKSLLFSEAVERLFQQIILCQQSSNHYELNYLFVLDLLFSEHNSSLPEKDKKTKDIEPIITYIESNLFEEIEINQICQKFGLSRATLYRIFEKKLGISIRQYINQRRMEEAKFLLKKGNHSISEVAFLVGYQDPFHFSSTYKIFFGAPPSQHRLK